MEQKEKLVKVSVLLPEQLHRELGDAAHSARLPLSNYLRQVLSGTTPAAAPPPLVGSQRLLHKLLSRLGSNLTQLHGHAERAGGRLAQLTAEGSALPRLHARRDELYQALDAGHLLGHAAELWLSKLDQPASLVNNLAARLNAGEELLPGDWYPALSALYAALVQDGQQGA